MFSRFFIERPIFAIVIAVVMILAGVVTVKTLPVAQYPDITPPTVMVAASYPGADAATVATTVGVPIEEQAQRCGRYDVYEFQLQFRRVVYAHGDF